MDPSVTEPLRREHQGLRPHIDRLRDVAAAPSIDGLDEAIEFLAEQLVPHALAEDVTLYPAVERLMAAPGATQSMSRDHVEVARMIHDLRLLRTGIGDASTMDADDLEEARRVLYGLYAVVRLHFQKEEELYLPVLDAGLGAEEAAVLFEAMEKAAARVRTTTHV